MKSRMRKRSTPLITAATLWVICWIMVDGLCGTLYASAFEASKSFFPGVVGNTLSVCGYLVLCSAAAYALLFTVDRFLSSLDQPFPHNLVAERSPDATMTLAMSVEEPKRSAMVIEISHGER